MRKIGERELDWDLGSFRIKYLGKLVNSVRDTYEKAKREQTVGSVYNYVVKLRTLYQELRPYIKDQDKRQELKNKIDELQDQVDLKSGEVEEEVFDKAEQLDQELNDQRIKLGLDIPFRNKPDPEKSAVKGLR